MKAFNILIKLAAIAALSFAVVACEVDPCKDSAERCLNGATCLDGTCMCADGYEGDSCKVKWATKFVKTSVNVTDVVSSGPGTGTYTYSMSISEGSSVTTLGSTNFGGFGGTNSVPFTLTGSSAISINYTDVAGRKFVGTGTFNAAGDLVISYTVTYSDQTVDTAVATCDF